MKFGRKDHFVPQGYLRGFVHPKRRREAAPLWVLDVQTGGWSKCATSDFAFGRGFYDMANSVADLVADEIFRKLENDFPRSRDAVRRQGYDTWPTARETFVYYAAMLSARSPLFLRQAASGALRPLPHESLSEERDFDLPGDFRAS